MASTIPNQRLSFIAEWYQEEAAIIRTFIMCFYLADNAIEVYDHRTKKTFLRRTKMQELSERDFFIGSKINVFGRQFDIVDYGDELTQNTLAKYRKKYRNATFILLKSTILHMLGSVLCAIVDSHININRGLMVRFTAEQAKGFLAGEANKGDVGMSVLMNQLTVGPSIGFELIADNVIEKVRLCQSQSQGQGEPDIQLPSALLTLFERDEIRNGIYCSQSEELATRNIRYFFEESNGFNSLCVLKNSTLAIIKPHAIKEGYLGKIVDEIFKNGFKITALRMNLLERVNCEEFYEVYRGILPEYIPMVAQMASGVNMALEIVCTDPAKNAYGEFREFCGPMDPEIAKLLRPHTLRAKYGVSKVLNAVHCTDLADDTVLELQYLFKIL